VVDCVIICSGDTTPHLVGMEREIDKILKSNRILGFRWQGIVASGWVLLDLGSIVVHILRSAEREYYNLEELWEKDAIVYHY